MPKLHISASWEVADDQRANAALIHGLAPEIEALEKKIGELTELNVRVEIGVKRVKKPNDTAVIDPGRARPVSEIDAAVRALGAKAAE